MSAAEIIAMIRDIAFLTILLLALILMLVLYRKVSAILGSIQRVSKNAEEIVSAVSQKVVKPATASSGIASGAGKAVAFLFGLARRRKGGDKNNGK